MKDENLAVYEAVKNTALHCEDSIRNARLQMYTIYFVMFPFGFTYSWVFLITFIVLITFQSTINSEQIAIARANSFLRVFFEEHRDDMHWSTLTTDNEHLKVYNKQYRDIGWFLNQHASSFLSIMSFLTMSILSITANLYTIPFPVYVCAQFAVGIPLCALAIIINLRRYDGLKDPEKMNAIHRSIEKFYEGKLPESATTAEKNRECQP